MTKESGDERTPTVEPLSATAINLLDLALSTESVAVSLREAAQQLHGATGVARQHILSELGGKVTRLGGTFVEAGEAMKEESQDPKESP